MIMTNLFLFFLALTTLTRLWLVQRQIQHVTANRQQVPQPFQEQISLQAHHKAADYTVAKARLSRWSILYESLLLLFWTLGGGIEMIQQWVSHLQLQPLFANSLIILAVILIAALLHLPFSLYSTFVIEKRFGFNKTTPGTYLSDLIKAAVIGLILGLPLIMLILWLINTAGTWWWLYAWLAWTTFGLLVSWLFPVVIAPLFNRFTPLADTALREKIDALIQRSGFKAKGIFVMDGSRRSSHGNAYFTGLGKNKRVVFFDTLLQTLTGKQTLAVLAHELGHFRHRHILKGLLLNAIASLIGFAFLAWLLPQTSLQQQLGVSNPSLGATLILFMLVVPVFTYFLQPLTAWWSRRHEFEADAYARQQTSGEDLITALVALYRDNASTLTPDPVYSRFYASHPPAMERIARLQTESSL